MVRQNQPRWGLIRSGISILTRPRQRWWRGAAPGLGRDHDRARRGPRVALYLHLAERGLSHQARSESTFPAYKPSHKREYYSNDQRWGPDGCICVIVGGVHRADGTYGRAEPARQYDV